MGKVKKEETDLVTTKCNYFYIEACLTSEKQKRF